MIDHRLSLIRGVFHCAVQIPTVDGRMHPTTAVQEDACIDPFSSCFEGLRLRVIDVDAHQG